MFDQALALESAQKICESYAVPSDTFPSASAISEPNCIGENPSGRVPVSAGAGGRCFFCGFTQRARARCPAREAICQV